MISMLLIVTLLSLTHSLMYSKRMCMWKDNWISEEKYGCIFIHLQEHMVIILPSMLLILCQSLWMWYMSMEYIHYHILPVHVVQYYCFIKTLIGKTIGCTIKITEPAIIFLLEYIRI